MASPFVCLIVLFGMDPAFAEQDAAVDAPSPFTMALRGTDVSLVSGESLPAQHDDTPDVGSLTSSPIDNDGTEPNYRAEILSPPPESVAPNPAATDDSFGQLAWNLCKPFIPHGYELYSDTFQVGGLFNPFVRRFPFPGQGPYPYRYGWSKYDEVSIIPQAHTNGVVGGLGFASWNASVQYARKLTDVVSFTWTGTTNSSYLSGPSGLALPGQVDLLASDFELTAQSSGPWSAQLAFTPQLVTNFEQDINSEAFNFDARAIAYFQRSPTLMFAIGAAFWNRVHNYLVPNAGIIWLPTRRWEFRLLFPKSQIIYLLGDWSGVTFWAYASLEYNIETYQVTVGDPGFTNRMQLRDNRLLFGLTSRYGRVSSFLEGGWVYNRQVRFQNPSPDFDIADGPMMRLGIKF